MISIITGMAFAAAIVLSSPLRAASQDDRYIAIDKGKVSASAMKASDFAPAGWSIENQTEGDVNGDGSSDIVITLTQDKAAEGKSRARALVVATAQKDKSWKNAAVARYLLDCVDCGNAMGELSVTIKKGVIVVDQAEGNSGSSMSRETYQFRFDQTTGRFLLIGADFLNGGGPDNMTSESDNYLTGQRKTTVMKKKDPTSWSKFDVTKNYLDTFDREKIETAAFMRIGK